METIAKWLKDSGLKLNETKTEICMVSRSDLAPVTVIVGGARIVSSDYMIVLGVIFDTKLSWSKHIKHSILKASKAPNAIKLNRRFFNTKELLQLITNNYFR